MFLVKTRLAPSPIEGLGVFADQDIRKGTWVWKFNAVLDRVVETADLRDLSEVEREFMRRYAYLNAKTSKWVVCVDDSRFINHSDSPNLVEFYLPGDPDGIDVAGRDIARGEELTSNYSAFDVEYKTKLGIR